MASYKINPDANSEKPMRSVQFFNLYFSNFGSIMLANILLLPFTLLAALYAAASYKLLGGLNIPIASASLIILNAGMSGVALVCRYIYTKKEFSVFQTFKKGVKENAARFAVHGLIFYIVFAISSLSVTLYHGGTKTNGIFWVPLVITALVSLFVLFASYYMNVMTVTMDISLRDTYRNCALFSFGELKNNIFTTIALAVMGAVIFTICYIVNNMWVILLILALLQAFVIPATVQYIITFYIYDDMVAILDETNRNRKGDEPQEEKKPSMPVLDRQEAEDISRIASDSKDEFIYYNGKMIKRSEVEKLLSSDDE